MNKNEMATRNREIDALRGILIIFVVLGHSIHGPLHDFIFFFHMPLFFVLSGVLISKDRIAEKGYFIKRVKQLMIPYFVYGIFDVLLFRCSIIQFLRLVWGGRAIGGVYWYATCYLFSLILLIFLVKQFSEKTCKLIILAGGGIAVLESNIITGTLGVYLSEKIPMLSRLIFLLQSPGIPWNLDVSLLALVYLGLGFFYKSQIKSMMQSKSKRYDIATIAVTVALAVLCYFNFSSGESAYYFDMKSVHYHELISALIIPCAFGFVLIRFILLISKIKVMNWLFDFLAFLGQMTIPIMFIHVPINTFQTQIGYGLVLYVFFGIGVPLAVVIAFRKYPVMRKLLGIPNLDKMRFRDRVER